MRSSPSLVLWDNLEERTDLVLCRHGHGKASNHPLVDDADLLVKLGAVLVPIPVSGLPFIAHLLYHILREIALKAGSINAHELAHAGKIGLTATLLHLALLGDKMNFPRRVGKCNTSPGETLWRRRDRTYRFGDWPASQTPIR